MDADLFADIDLDALLASFSGETAAVVSEVLAPSPPPPPPARDAETGSPESVTSRRASPPGGEEALSEIERFLMEEGEAEATGDVEGISVEEFFDALYDGGEGDGQEKQRKESEAGGSTDGHSGREEEVELMTPQEDAEVDGDPISKKKRRQMRNRDSAMKSRERKKLYIKDLERKNKYLEAECHRLSYVLQCYAAENMALRQNVMKDRPVGAPTAKQESAVLTGTLPLVSLLWLVSIVCLFLMPGLPNPSPAAPRSPGRDHVTVAGKTASSEKPQTTLALIVHGRRCKGTRVKIKQLDTPCHAAAAC